MFEDAGRITNPANPYIDRSDEYVHVKVPEPPVLTVRDLEHMVADRLDVERRTWHKEQQRACLEAWERGAEYARKNSYESGYAAAAHEVGLVVRGTLQHIVRRLHDRRDREKSTIAAERKFIGTEAKNLDAVLDRLEEIARGES